jgi:hypothetical protein
MGSVCAARQAGSKQAATETSAITANAEPNATGSRGLTLYSRLPSRRVSSSAAALPAFYTALIGWQGLRK